MVPFLCLFPVFLFYDDGGSNSGIIEWQIAGVDEAYTDEITLYPGEQVTLTAMPASGRMVAGWDADGTYETTTEMQKTYTYDALPLRFASPLGILPPTR